jgi:hypothetical protein
LLQVAVAVVLVTVTAMRQQVAVLVVLCTKPRIIYILDMFIMLLSAKAVLVLDKLAGPAVAAAQTTQAQVADIQRVQVV